jgi:hypothetical protein
MKNTNINIENIHKSLDCYDAEVSSKKKLKFAAETANLHNCIFSVGEKIIFVIKKVSCSDSTITAPHIYIAKEANFGNCKLNGEVHYSKFDDLISLYSAD